MLNFLIGLFGKNHIYVQSLEPDAFVQPVVRDQDVLEHQAVLQSVKEDIQSGYLTDTRTLISAEIFDDFLNMADHLLECGYKDPAASLCGAVLEDGLRRIASNAGVNLRNQEDLSSLNHKCADAGIYNRLVQKKIQVWGDIRNNADHGKFNEYSQQDVEDMLKEVRQFLEGHLR